MDKVKCILIDDEPIAIRILERHLSVFPEMEVVATFNSAPLAMNFMRQNQVDLIFSDIEMPQMNGLQFLRSLQHRPAIVFTTAYRDYAVEAFDLDVVDYLLKPVSLERMGRALTRYHERYCGLDNTHTPDSVSESFINLKADKKIIRIAIDKINYIESYGDYIICYHEDGKVISRERISNLEQSLPKEQFIRIHRQYIIPVNKIEAISGNMVTITGKDLPVGRSYRQNLKQQIDR